MLDLLTPLRDYGLVVIEAPGWRTRGRSGLYSPVGVIGHHTAGSQRGGPMASFQSVLNGRPDLSGPLANGYVDRLARPHLVAAGRANHGGAGYLDTLAHAKVGTPVPYKVAPGKDNGADGNRWYLGIEVENDGVGEVWSDAVVATTVTMMAAWCDAFGWHHQGCVHHRQHSRRKIDMTLDIDLGRWVGIRIYTQHVPTPPGPEPLPSLPSPWRYDDVNIVQHPVHVNLDPGGNGYNDADCRIEAVIGEPRMNGTLAVYDVSPTLRHETYGKDGKTRIEVQGGKPNSSVDFVVSAVAP